MYIYDDGSVKAKQLEEGPEETAQERGQLGNFVKPTSSPTADAAAACSKAKIL